MAKDDGGSAFPFFDIRVMNSPEFGMSMRDYFAAKAMASLLSNEEAIQRFRSISMSEGFESGALMANAAYQIADDMIAERAK